MRSTPAASKKPSINVGEQRVYHVTHSSNLPGILATGSLLADGSDAWSERPNVDISSAENRETRRATTVAGAGELTVADYVPFFLSPNASLWGAIRSGSTDPRLSPAIRGVAASEFVILVSTVKALRSAQAGNGSPGRPEVVVADGDAADSGARCATSSDAYERMLRQLITDEESDALQHAELLVRDAVPFESVSLIGVMNDRARESVKGILASSGCSPRVAVHPPWFAAPSSA